MSSSNVIRSAALLGKTIKIRESVGGRVSCHEGMVTAVVMTVPGATCAEAVMIGCGPSAQFHHLEDFELVSVT